MRIERIYPREQGLMRTARISVSDVSSIEGVAPLLDDDAVTFDPEEQKEGATQQEQQKQKKKEQEPAEKEAAELKVIDLMV